MKKETGRLKIAMLGHKSIPSREGGIEVVVEELSTRMVKLGHDVTCLNRKRHRVSGKEIDNDFVKQYRGVRIKPVFTINWRGWAALTSSFSAAIEAAFGEYDVVHFHAEGSCGMMWLPKRMGKRCIVTIHGLDHRRAKWGILAKLYLSIGEKMAVKFADEIIVLNENTRRYFKSRYGRDTHFISNGVNRAVIMEPDLIRQQYGLRKNEYILFLGRLVPEKGIQYLIEAFSKVNTKKKLVIAGCSSDTDKYTRKLIKMAAADDRILFTGFVQRPILDELYSNAYLYTLPTDLEGMSLSLLEAMSYGCCCLVSDIPECTEVVEDKAVLFRKGDISDLRDKLQMLCDDEAMVNRYKKASADFICRKYHWDEVVEKTLKLYTHEN